MVQTVMTDASIKQFIENEEAVLAAQQLTSEETEQSFERVHNFMKRGIDNGLELSKYLSDRLSAFVSLYPPEVRESVVQRLEGVSGAEYVITVMRDKIMKTLTEAGMAIQVDLTNPLDVAKHIAPMLRECEWSNVHEILDAVEDYILDASPDKEQYRTDWVTYHTAVFDELSALEFGAETDNGEISLKDRYDAMNTLICAETRKRYKECPVHGDSKQETTERRESSASQNTEHRGANPASGGDLGGEAPATPSAS